MKGAQVHAREVRAAVRLQRAEAELAAAVSDGCKDKKVTSVHSVQVRTFHALQAIVISLGDIGHKYLKQTGVQPKIEKLLYDIVLTDAFASTFLTSVLRRLVGKCWAKLFSQGDIRELLPLAGKLQSFVGSKGKSTRSLLAAYTCLECVASDQNHGRVLAGHLPDTVKLVMKLVRSSKSEARLRSSAVRCLAASILGAAGAGKCSH